MNKLTIVLSLLIVGLFACQKDEENEKNDNDSGNNQVVDFAKQKADESCNTSSAGLYKGVIAGSSGVFLLNIKNGNSQINGQLVLDEKEYILTIKKDFNWEVGQPISKLEFKSGDICLTFSVDKDGKNPIIEFSAPNHPNAIASVAKETSDNVLCVYQGYSIDSKIIGGFPKKTHKSVLNITINNDKYTLVQKKYALNDKEEIISDNYKTYVLKGSVVKNENDIQLLLDYSAAGYSDVGSITISGKIVGNNIIGNKIQIQKQGFIYANEWYLYGDIKAPTITYMKPEPVQSEQSFRISSAFIYDDDENREMKIEMFYEDNKIIKQQMYVKNNSEWILSGKTEVEYNGTKITRIEYEKEDGNWVKSMKFEREYTNDLLSKSIFTEYEDNNQAYVTEKNYTYNGTKLTNIIKYVTSKYNNNTKTLDSKVSYTYTNEKLVKEESKDANNQIIGKKEYTYSGSNIISTLSYNKDQEGEFVFDEKMTFTYNSENRIITRIREYYNGGWKKDDDYAYEYDGKYIIKITNSYDGDITNINYEKGKSNCSKIMIDEGDIFNIFNFENE